MKTELVNERPALKGDHDEAGHVHPVPHREVPVRLQRSDEEQQERLKQNLFIRINIFLMDPNRHFC